MKRKGKRWTAYVLTAVLLSGIVSSQESGFFRSLAAEPSELSGAANSISGNVALEAPEDELLEQEKEQLLLQTVSGQMRLAFPVPLTEEYFPDSVLLAFVHALDENKDGILSKEEAEKAEEMLLPKQSIHTLQGIEYLPKLKRVDVSGNHIEDFTPLGALGALEELKVSANPAKELDVSGCSSLKRLYAAGGSLSELKVSGLSELTELRAEGNQLSALDMGGCSALEILTCQGNQITSMDVSGAGNLRILEADGNGMREIKAAGLGELETLHLQDNELSGIDLSGLSSLEELDVTGNGLNSLTLSGLGSLKRVFAGGNHLTGSLDVGTAEYVSIENNQLSGVSAGANLLYLNARWNQLDTVSLEGASPERVYVTGNLLERISVQTQRLQTMHCGENRLPFVEAGCALEVELSPQNIQLVRKYDGEKHWTDLGELFSREQLERTEVAAGGGQVSAFDRASGRVSYNGPAETLAYHYVAGTVGAEGTNARMLVTAALTEEKVEAPQGGEGEDNPQGGGNDNPQGGEGEDNPQGGGNGNSQSGGNDNSQSGGNGNPPSSDTAVGTQDKKPAASRKEPPVKETGKVPASQKKPASDTVGGEKERQAGIWQTKEGEIPMVRWNASDGEGRIEIRKDGGEKLWLVYEGIEEQKSSRLWKMAEESGIRKAEIENHRWVEIHLQEEDGTKVQPDGKMQFYLQYPEGSGREDSFFILHLKEEEEVITLAEGSDYTKEEEGFLITVESFSPFLVSWKSEEAGAPEEEGEETVKEAEEEMPVASTEMPKAATKEKGQSGAILLLAVLLIAAGGGVWYYFYRKKKEGR